MILRYVNQRADWDCGIACLAMVSDRSYEEIADEFSAHNIQGVGIEGLLFDWWFRKNDFAVQCATPDVGCEWPPMPFAPVHIVYVRATQGSHVCVMSSRGGILDPFNALRTTLAHPDYKSVRGVIGIWNIAGLKQQAGNSTHHPYAALREE